MNFEPQKFFIGLVDFFSILLPGALLTYFLKDSIGPRLLGDSYCTLAGSNAGWIAFLFSSYLLGHFLFLVGSLLDDLLYDPIKKCTNGNQIKRLIQGRNLSPWILRKVASYIFKRQADAALDRVLPIKEAYLSKIEATNSVNAFQWCKVRLLDAHHEALALVNRFEADSKFFRSFVPLICGYFIFTLLTCEPVIAAGSLLLLALALWRYMDQRFKSTQQAYWSILILEAQDKDTQQKMQIRNGQTYLQFSKEKSVDLTHAGGVVFRKREKQLEYLLVQAKDNPTQWVLPKGHIELGEDTRFSAIREVKEETGVWARIKKEKLKDDNEGEIEKEISFKPVEYTVKGKKVRVLFYLMEKVEESTPEEKWRKHLWLSFEEVKQRPMHGNIQDLLEQADKLLHGPGK